MATTYDKEELFENYFFVSTEVFRHFEWLFHVEGVFEQIFGVKPTIGHGFDDEATEATARARLRSSESWQTLSRLYDYAVDGILHEGEHVEDIVIDGAEVLSYVTTENRGPSTEWHWIVALGDGRFSLDEGDDVQLEKVALLANVDVRTVRNAISAGELLAKKVKGLTFVENATLRNWLSRRRGFKSTRIAAEHIAELRNITRPAEFGAFLCEQRKKLGLDTQDGKLVPLHPGVDATALAEIERGIFRLPIDSVFPLADFYHLDRKELLAAVMRVFFSKQFQSLSELITDHSKGGQ